MVMRFQSPLVYVVKGLTELRFFIVFMLSCDCLCYLFFPHGAVNWSVVYDCGISWSDFSIFRTMMK